VVAVHPAVKKVALGIPGQVQQINASLAIALVQEYLKSVNLPTMEITATTLPPVIVKALENARWPGRCETRVEKDVTWYCDGAHTAESVAVAAQWYSSMYCLIYFTDNSPRSDRKMRILLFNQQTRNATALVNNLFSNTTVPFDRAIFCTNITFKRKGYKEGTSLSGKANKISLA